MNLGRTAVRGGTTLRHGRTGAPRAACAQRAGFTLLEVLVALVVMAVALGAGVRALGQAADVSAALAQRTLARWVAEDHMALLQARKELPDVGTRVGKVQQGEVAFAWTETSEDPPQSPFRRIVVQVRAAGTDGPDLARLSIFVLRPPT